MPVFMADPCQMQRYARDCRGSTDWPTRYPRSARRVVDQMWTTRVSRRSDRAGG
jgi:hypothetical protein